MNIKPPIFAALYCSTLLFAPQVCSAGGLLGDFISAIGNAAGIPQIRQLGRDMDKAHAQFKNENELYKRFEEEATRFARLPLTMTCVQAFEAVAQPVKLTCNRFVSQSSPIASQEAALIGLAQSQLLNAGVFKQGDFDGISIRWCQGDFKGGAITPNSEEIILNRSLKDKPWTIAPTLAHEMAHIAQYRRMGTDNFKCDYATKLAACGLCQDDRHALEKEAYAFEDSATKKLLGIGYQFASVEVTPTGEIRTFGAPIFLKTKGAPEYLFPGLDTAARSGAIRVCTTVRGTPKYDSQACIQSLDIAFSLKEEVKRELAAQTPAGRQELIGEMGDTLKEWCADVFGNNEEDAYDRTASATPVRKLAKSQVEACAAESKKYLGL